MKVMVLKWSGYGYMDMIPAFENCGHEVFTVDFNKDDPRSNEEVTNELKKKIDEIKPDFMFSFNYFPIIAIVGKETQTKYVSWIYDSPYVLMYSYTVIFPTNYVFVFDKELYLEFRNNRIDTVYYLPLASNPKRINSFKDWDKVFKSHWINKTDISFVGALYTEDHQFYSRLKNIAPYTRGYLEGIMAAQKNVYGYNFIKELLTSEIMDDMYRDLPMEPNPDGVETKEYLYAQYVINRRLTAIERTRILTLIGTKHQFDLYTHDMNFKVPGCINHGVVGYLEDAPHVFHNSKINLNITLRSITSGVPLRAFEIMGAEGFLLTNYQADFADVYVADEDYVYYESEEDLMAKIDYYLSHEDRRREIAHNGYVRTLENHTFEHRIEEIVNVISQ